MVQGETDLGPLRAHAEALLSCLEAGDARCLPTAQASSRLTSNRDFTAAAPVGSPRLSRRSKSTRSRMRGQSRRCCPPLRGQAGQVNAEALSRRTADVPGPT